MVQDDSGADDDEEEEEAEVTPASFLKDTEGVILVQAKTRHSHAE